MSPRKRRRQAYSQLIRLFLQNTRDRLETIRDVIKDEGELHFRLVQPEMNESNERMPVRENGDNDDDSMMQNAKIRFSKNENTNDHDDARNRQFIDFAFADTASASDETIDMDGKGENLSRDHAREYLNSLFAAVGYSRITATPPPSSSSPSSDTTQGDIIAKYLINPLQSVWNATLERFSLNNVNNGSVNAINIGARTNNKTVAQTSFDDKQTSIYRVNFANNKDIKPKMHTNARNDMNKDPNEMRADNFNYSLPLIQFAAANNVTVDVVPANETVTTTTTSTMPTMFQLLSKNANKINASDAGMLDVDYVGADHSGSSDKKPRNTASDRSSTEEDAAIAFQNAFLKYSNFMQQQQRQSMEHAKRNTTPHIASLKAENVKFAQDNRNEMRSSKLLDGGFFTDNSPDGMNSSNIQVVASNKKQKPNGPLSESVSSANSDDDNGTELNVKTFGEHAGILILEVFGTVIGKIWRAISRQ